MMFTVSRALAEIQLAQEAEEERRVNCQLTHTTNMKHEITQTSPPATRLEIMGFTPEQIAVLPMDNLRELIKLKNEQDDRDAEKVFNSSLAAFQSECPTIKKTKSVHTKSGAKAFDYAPYEVIKHIVQPIMTKHGFSSSLDQEQDGNAEVVTVACSIAHSSGAMRVTRYSVPVGVPNALTDAAKERVKATTIARRNAFLCALDISCEDMDAHYYDDPAPSTITREEADVIRELVDQVIDPGPFWAWVGASMPEEIPVAKFDRAVTALGKIIAKQGGGE